MCFIVTGPVASISIQLQPTSATISWSIPDYVPANYPIVTYEIGYYINIASRKRQITLSERATLQNTSSSPYTINNLEPQTSYVFAVRAYTRFGPGEWVGVVNQTLEEATTSLPGINIITKLIQLLHNVLCSSGRNWCSRWGHCCTSTGSSQYTSYMLYYLCVSTP